MKILMQILLFGLIHSSLFSQNNWSSEGTIGGSSETRHRAVGFSIGNKGYVGTGTKGTFGNQGYREYKDFWEYDPITKVWTQLADVGGTSRYDAVGFSIGDKGYIGIGRHLSPSSEDVYLQDMWEYNKSTNTWTNVGNILGGPRYGAVSFVIGNKAYVGTGWISSMGSTTDFFEFDPASNYTWTQKASFEGIARTFATGFSICGKGYIGTGLIADNTGIDDFWEYDPTSNDWVSKNSFDGGSCYAAKGFAICTKGYMLKGAEAGICDSKKLYEYNPSNDSWTQKASITSEFRFYPVAFSIGSKGYVGTGKQCGEDTYFNSFLSYTPSAAEPPMPPGPITGEIAVCESSIHVYTVEAISCANNYTWSVPTNSTIVSGQGTHEIVVAFGSISGIIGVSASNNCGQSIVEALPIIVNNIPQVMATGSATICEGSTTPLLATGASQYLWYPSIGLSNPLVSNPIASPDQTTIYYVIGTTNGCVDTSEVAITVLPKPIVSSQGSTTMCFGDSTSISASGATMYQWLPVTGLSNPAIANPIAFPVVTTTYTVIGSSNGCPDSSSVTITVNPVPDRPDTISGNLHICINTPQNYAVSPNPDATGYMWSLPGGWFSPNLLNASINCIPDSSGYLSVQVIQGQCISDPYSVYVHVASPPGVLNSIQGNSLLCKGDQTLFFTQEAGENLTFHWSLPNGSKVETEENSIILVSDTSGTLQVYSENECDTSNTVSLELIVREGVPDIPTVFSTISEVCRYSTSAMLLTDQTDVDSFYWMLPSGWSGSSTTSELEFTVNDESGTILVYGINACGLSSGLTIPVTIGQINTSIIVLQNQLALVENGPNTEYQWVDCPDFSLIPGAINSSFTPSHSGSYAAIIRKDGCSDTTACNTFIVTGIQPQIQEILFAVSPNPFNDIIEVKSQLHLMFAEVYDLNGRKVITKQTGTPNTISIDMHSISAGVYLLYVMHSGGIDVIKIIKQ